MAKLDTRSAHGVAKIHATRPASAGEGDVRYLLAYRSDGKVLSRITHIRGHAHSTGYSLLVQSGPKVMAKIRPDGAHTHDMERVRDWLRYIARRFGLTPED